LASAVDPHLDHVILSGAATISTERDYLTLLVDTLVVAQSNEVTRHHSALSVNHFSVEPNSRRHLQRRPAKPIAKPQGFTGQLS
jgi:hypothetical protein